MDALSLVLPATPIAVSGANGGDAGAADARGETTVADFAALLAAGLLPQQELPGLLPVPVPAAQATGEPAELELAELAAEAASLDLAGTALLPHPVVMTQAHAGPDEAVHEARAAASEGLLVAAGARTAPRPTIAADAATIRKSRVNNASPTKGPARMPA